MLFRSSAVLSFIGDIPTTIANVSPLLADAASLTTGLRNFIAPFVLLACSLAALTFLFKREFMQMIIFAVAAIVVFAIFYAPEMLSNLGKSVGESNKDLTWN